MNCEHCAECDERHYTLSAGMIRYLQQCRDSFFSGIDSGSHRSPFFAIDSAYLYCIFT